MKTEFLKDLGLDKEVIDKIMAENGKDINAAKADLETTKQNLATTQEELKQTQEQLSTANKTIDGFKDYDDIKAQVQDYKAKYQKAEDEKTQIKSDYAFQSKLKDAAKKAGVINYKAVLPFLDQDELKASKNQDADIAGKFEELKTADDTKFLFGSKEPIESPTAPLGSNGHNSSALDAVAKAMGLTENDMKE
jgi:chromosome segregation ATPase